MIAPVERAGEVRFFPFPVLPMVETLGGGLSAEFAKGELKEIF